MYDIDWIFQGLETERVQQFCCHSIIILFFRQDSNTLWMQHEISLNWSCFLSLPLLSLLPRAWDPEGLHSMLDASGAHKHPSSIPSWGFRISNPSITSSKCQDSMNAAVIIQGLCISTARALEVLSEELSQLKGEQEKAHTLWFTVVIKKSSTAS